MHIPFTILYEDNHIIAVNKKAGKLVHSDITGDKTLMDEVKQYIKVKYKKPGDVFLGLVHRIDRPVSGAVTFARTSKGLSRMNELFRERKIEKVYHAIVQKRPLRYTETITHYLLKDTQKNFTHAFKKKKKNAKISELEYTILAEFPNNVLLQVKPHTGRSHQIRAQLNAIGCPIIGDLKYGYDKPNHDKSISLHCRKMSFIHPVARKPIIIEAAYPELNIWNQFKDLV